MVAGVRVRVRTVVAGAGAEVEAEVEVSGAALVGFEVSGVEMVGADGGPLAGGTDGTEEHGVQLHAIRDSLYAPR